MLVSPEIIYEFNFLLRFLIFKKINNFLILRLNKCEPMLIFYSIYLYFMQPL